MQLRVRETANAHFKITRVHAQKMSTTERNTKSPNATGVLRAVWFLYARSQRVLSLHRQIELAFRVEGLENEAARSVQFVDSKDTKRAGV
jgi:predicted secreted Zn-dependent protease